MKIFLWITFIVFAICVVGCATRPVRYGAGEKYIESPSILTIYSPWVCEPRLGMNINSRRSLSVMEWWEAIPLLGIPAKIYNSVLSATGKTATQNTFDKRLDSPGSKFNIDLVSKLYQRRLISTNQYKKYVKNLLNNGFFNYYVIKAMEELKTTPPKEVLQDEIMFKRWNEGHGFSIRLYEYLLSELGTEYSSNLNQQIEISLKDNIFDVMPETILCCEKFNIKSSKWADAMLSYRFYNIYKFAVYGRATNPFLINKLVMEKELTKLYVAKSKQVLEDVNIDQNNLNK